MFFIKSFLRSGLHTNDWYVLYFFQLLLIPVDQSKNMIWIVLYVEWLLYFWANIGNVLNKFSC